MTREEIDKVIERAETFNSEDRSNRGSEYVTEHGLIGAIEAAQLYINRLLAAVKQLRKENADLTNRLTGAQDFINDRIEKGRR